MKKKNIKNSYFYKEILTKNFDNWYEVILKIQNEYTSECTEEESKIIENGKWEEVEKLLLSKENNVIDAWQLRFIENFDSYEVFILEFISITEKMQNKIFCQNEYNSSKIIGDLFIEIDEIVKYFIDKIFSDRLYYFTFERFYPNEKYYHGQVEDFLYLYSVLDKMTSLLEYHYNSNSRKKYKPKYRNLYYKNDFIPLLKILAKENQGEKFGNVFNEINKSKLFSLVSDMRNNLDHNFTMPLHTYNFNSLIFSLLVIILMHLEILQNIEWITSF